MFPHPAQPSSESFLFSTYSITAGFPILLAQSYCPVQFRTTSSLPLNKKTSGSKNASSRRQRSEGRHLRWTSLIKQNYNLCSSWVLNACSVSSRPPPLWTLPRCLHRSVTYKLLLWSPGFLHMDRKCAMA